MISIIPRPNVIKEEDGEFVFFNAIKYHSKEETETDWIISQFCQDLDAMGLGSRALDEEEPNLTLKLEKKGNLREDRHCIQISHKVIKIEFGGKKSLLHAFSSLIQLIEPVNLEDAPRNLLKIPVARIEDYPHAPYRGLMIDVARKPHTIDTLKMMVLLCYYYKINYLHVHFTDKQSYTLPSRALPKLPSKKRHFTFQEIKELVDMADKRGVTIVPEIDMPGHSKAMISAMPALFAVNTKKNYKRILNAGKEEVYEAIDKIVSEVCDMFPNSPYIHLGADEASYDGAEDDPDVARYMKEQGIPNTKELYRHFITRIYEIIEQHDRKLCIWEGFRPKGAIEIPKDVPVFIFECYHNPKWLLDAGYDVVNTSWQPIYAVPRKSWPAETIYKWNMYRWENWSDHSAAYDNPFQFQPQRQILGAEMCSWEQREKDQLPEIRRRLAALSENVWNESKAKSVEKEINEKDVDDFMERLKKADAKLTRLLKGYFQQPNLRERLKKWFIRLLY